MRGAVRVMEATRTLHGAALPTTLGSPACRRDGARMRRGGQQPARVGPADANMPRLGTSLALLRGNVRCSAGWMVCLSVAALTWSSAARAESVGLRTSVAPTTGTGVQIHPRVSLRGSVQGRFIASGPRLGDRQSLGVGAGALVSAHPVVAASMQYEFGYGHFPLEGTATQEHRAQLGIRLGNPAAERFAVSHLTRLDFRTYKTLDRGFSFHMRPRTELRLTGIIHRAFQISQASEVLVQPSDGLRDMLQLRFALALHGDIPLSKREQKHEGDRSPPSLYWIVADQFGLSPIAMAVRRTQGPAGDTVASQQHADRANTLDMVLTIGVGALF